MGGGDPSARREKQRVAMEAERDALVKHLQQQDHRLQMMDLQKHAAREKRLADAFNPRPARRKMYDDVMLAMAAQIPGPGEYTPRLRDKDSVGKTFGAQPFVSQSGTSAGTSQVYDRDAGSPDAWKVKTAAMQPGPASYSPERPRAACGSTFGLPPELRELKGRNKMPPDAHDINRMVKHLRDLPAPDAYSPRDPMEKNKGFRIVPSKALSTLEQVIQQAEKVPGPGTYDLSGALSAGRSSVLGGGGEIKSELEVAMERARQVPGPGAYQHASELRSVGSPRFSSAGGLSLIETIQVEARTKPGPGTYNPTLTFDQEKQKRKFVRDFVKGDMAASPRR